MTPRERAAVALLEPVRCQSHCFPHNGTNTRDCEECLLDLFTATIAAASAAARHAERARCCTIAASYVHSGHEPNVALSIAKEIAMQTVPDGGG